MTPELKAAIRSLYSRQLEEGYKFEGLYPWLHPDGSVLYYRIRLKHPETKDKHIRAFHKNGNGYKPGRFNDGQDPVTPLPYGYDPTIKTEGIPYFIVEGEKCVDALAKLGALAITSGGADSASTVDWTPLKDQEVIIWPDNDEPGNLYKNKLIEVLTPIASKISIIDVSALNPPDKGDCVDYLESNPETTLEAVYALPSLQPEKPISKYKLMKASEWVTQELYPISQIIPDLFDRGDKVAIIGKSKTRKSFFALQLALCLAAGRQFLSYPSGFPCKVLLIQFEIKEAHFHKRIKHLSESLDIHPSYLEGLSIINCRGIEFNKEEIGTLIKELSPEVVILDPLYKLMPPDCDENSSKDFKDILLWFDRLAEAVNAAVIYVHHDKKGSVGNMDLTDRGAGSGVLARDFDASFFLTPHEEGEDVLVLDTMTRNYPEKKRATIEWMDYRFEASEKPPIVASPKTAKEKNKLGLDEAIELTEKLIQDAGKDGVSVGKLIIKLREVTSKRIADEAKNNVIEKSSVQLFTGKAGKGQSSKILIWNDNKDEDLGL